ncbi:phosphatidylinositol-3,5-bisphosphate 5-phosphatase, partial [Entomophthora muscae]
MNPPGDTSPPNGYYHYAQSSSRKGSDLSQPNSDKKSSGTPPILSPTCPVKKSMSRSTSAKSGSDLRLAPKAAVSSKSLAIATEKRTILHKFTIYETKTRLYVVGSNLSEDRFRILKVDRTSSSDLSLTADDVVYSKADCIDLLSRIDQGNKLAGGLTKV